jgi:hypothetical protein
MYEGRIVFSQLMDWLPKYEYDKCVQRYRGNRYVKSFSCFDQFLTMAFAQLTYRESLRDIETCLRALKPKLYRAGIKGKVSRNTLAKANERRDWRIFSDFAQVLIGQAKTLYAEEEFCLELDQAAYALDSTTIDLCLSLFPWAKFRKRKGAIKLHTLLNLRGCFPSVVIVTTGKVSDVKILDHLAFEPGAFYIMDRGYLDFARLYDIKLSSAFFITRAKKNFQFTRRYSRPVDKTTGLRCDQTITLKGFYSRKDYPEALRRVCYFDAETNKEFVFLSNNFTEPALTIAKLYKCRWRVELFFKWIKQHLRIKAFYGTSENAVKTQVWVAISIYVLVAIIKKRLNLDQSLYTILQVLSVTLFEKTSVLEVFSDPSLISNCAESKKQLDLWDI